MKNLSILTSRNSFKSLAFFLKFLAFFFFLILLKCRCHFSQSQHHQYSILKCQQQQLHIIHTKHSKNGKSWQKLIIALQLLKEEDIHLSEESSTFLCLWASGNVTLFGLKPPPQEPILDMGRVNKLLDSKHRRRKTVLTALSAPEPLKIHLLLLSTVAQRGPSTATVETSQEELATD